MSTRSPPAALPVAEPPAGSTILPLSSAEPVVLVQVLRALAALLVVSGHTLSATGRLLQSQGRAPPLLAFPGGFGVDLFFAISGFIMVVASGALFGKPCARRLFLTRRAIRLVPLYWAATLLYLPVIVLGSRGYDGNLLTALTASLGFIPYASYPADGSNNPYPLYTLGWTLNYEVFFYAIFSLFIVLPRRLALGGVSLILLMLVVGGEIAHPQAVALRFWTQPILLEFGFGLALAALWLGNLRLDWRVCVLIAAAAVLFVALDPAHLAMKEGGPSTSNDFRRVWSWGIPAAAILLAAAFLESSRTLGGKSLAALTVLGDSSYSLYLVHPFALLALTKVWRQIPAPSPTELACFGVLAVTASCGLAVLMHRYVEKPVTRGLRRYFRQRGVLRDSDLAPVPLPTPAKPGMLRRS
jgi:peptidoglycan/LPS O-acetylase OafA/YrhL